MGLANMPLLRSRSMLLCPLLVTLCLLCLVLLVMSCGKVGVLGSSRSGRLRVGMRFLLSLPLTSSLFRSIQIDDVRSWVLSSAPAASVGLGATFSPATWDRVSGVGHSSLCPWGCQSAGYWDHICWSCSCRPAHAPDKPACAFLARFGWTLSTNHLDPTQVTKVRGWLTECQSAIWSAKDH